MSDCDVHSKTLSWFFAQIQQLSVLAIGIEPACMLLPLPKILFYLSHHTSVKNLHLLHAEKKLHFHFPNFFWSPAFSIAWPAFTEPSCASLVTAGSRVAATKNVHGSLQAAQCKSKTSSNNWMRELHTVQDHKVVGVVVGARSGHGCKTV